jgi:hypothetical protein
MKTTKLERQKTVRYKVVKRRSRGSCSLNGNSKYSLKYKKETEVHARPETVGVMCFVNFEDAKFFMRRHPWLGEHLMILKVIPMGKGKRIDEISVPRKLNEYYHSEQVNHCHFYILPAPRGTICYPAVYVTE